MVLPGIVPCACLYDSTAGRQSSWIVSGQASCPQSPSQGESPRFILSFLWLQTVCSQWEDIGGRRSSFSLWLLEVILLPSSLYCSRHVFILPPPSSWMNESISRPHLVKFLESPTECRLHSWVASWSYTPSLSSICSKSITPSSFFSSVLSLITKKKSYTCVKNKVYFKMHTDFSVFVQIFFFWLKDDFCSPSWPLVLFKATDLPNRNKVSCFNALHPSQKP